jgi:hypothetical protein
MAQAKKRHVVDIDAAVTWPQAIRSRAEELANVLRGTTRYVGDLRGAEGVAEEFRSLFKDYSLRAYHATRLLDHEVVMIRDQGLRILSEELIRERIEAAHHRGHLTSDERAALLVGNVFAEGRARNRAGHVNLFISTTPLRTRVHGVRPPLTTWGGEGIYMAKGGYDLRARLSRIGRPTIVVVNAELGPNPQAHGIGPERWKLFVGRLLGFEPEAADLITVTPVPPSDVVEIWQPGDQAYARFEQLPRG